MVILDLQNPKEKFWGRLLQITPAGLWLKGINLASFEDWIRQFSPDEEAEDRIGLATSFFPMHRLERVTLDEALGEIPSYLGLLEQRAGYETAQEILREDRSFNPVTGLPEEYRDR